MSIKLWVQTIEQADILEVKDAIGSAVDMMQAMRSSICSLISKVIIPNAFLIVLIVLV